jgi:hypothetical protein
MPAALVTAALARRGPRRLGASPPASAPARPCRAACCSQRPPLELQLPTYPDLRVSTLTPASIQLLQRVGAWDELLDIAPTFARMQVCASRCVRCAHSARLRQPAIILTSSSVSRSTLCHMCCAVLCLHLCCILWEEGSCMGWLWAKQIVRHW